MSSPVDQRLKDLNLNPEMVASTRGKGKGRQAAQGQASQQAAQAGPSNTNYLTSRISGTTYDIQGFSEAARARADLGFNRTSGGPLKDARDHGEYFLFELNLGKILVRVRPPGPNQFDPRVCTCDKANADIACEHVFWLVDQVVPAASSEPIKLEPNGMTVAGVPLFELIREIGAEELKQRTEQRPTHSSAAATEEEDREAVKERMLNQLHEILSTFEPGIALSDELRSEAERVYKEFSDEIVRIAYQRPGAVDRLESIVPSQLRAAIHFEKLRGQVNQAFYEFDHSDEFDAAACVARLKELVDQVVEDYTERGASKSPNVARYAVAALITILEGVVHRKGQLYRLAMGPPNASVGFKVLEALSTKPAEVLSLYRDRIAHIAREIETGGAPAPIASLLGNVAGIVGVGVVTGAPESQKRKGPGDTEGSKKKGKSKK